MRNGFLGSLVALSLTVSLATAQTPSLPQSPDTGQPLDCPWDPPHTELDPRPNLGPAGYPYYGNAEYILWWTAKDRPVVLSPSESAILPDFPATATTIDNGPLLRNGLQSVFGIWLDQQQTIGLESGGFWVDDRTPGLNSETANDLVDIRSRLHNSLWGVDAKIRAEVYRGTWAHVDLVGGFSFLSLDESLAIDQSDPTASVVTSDRIGAHNRFYAGQLGAETELHYNKWFVDLSGLVALGVNDETIDVNGTTVTSGLATPGGALAAPAFDGSHHRDQFAVAPQTSIHFGYELLQNVRVTAGYTFMYLSNAARPGEQIEALSRSPQPSSFPFQSGQFWVQGLDLGIEFRF